MMGTYSISWRVRRVTYEDAYIAVPVTDAIMRTAEDGSSRIDIDAMMAEVQRIARDSRVEWVVESTEIEPHPIQQARPEGRPTLDTYYDDPSLSNVLDSFEPEREGTQSRRVDGPG